MPEPRKWTSDENEFLMDYGYRIPWDLIADKVNRTQGACKAQYNKIRKLRKTTGTWKGIR